MLQKRRLSENNKIAQEKQDQFIINNIELPNSVLLEKDPGRLKSLIKTQMQKMDQLVYDYEGLQIILQKQQQQIENIDTTNNDQKIQELQKQLAQKKIELRDKLNKQNEEVAQIDRIQYDTIKSKKEPGIQVLKHTKNILYEPQELKKLSNQIIKFYNEITINNLFLIYQAYFLNKNQDVIKTVQQEQQKLTQSQRTITLNNTQNIQNQLRAQQVKIQNKIEQLQKFEKEIKEKDIKLLQRLNALIISNAKRTQFKQDLESSLRGSKVLSSSRNFNTSYNIEELQ